MLGGDGSESKAKGGGFMAKSSELKTEGGEFTAKGGEFVRPTVSQQGCRTLLEGLEIWTGLCPSKC
jgi:hypothetical protein